MINKIINKVAIVTLGCAKNQDDSRHLSSYLRRKGFLITDDLNQAHAVVIHTCSFIEDAKRESIETILKLAEQKKPGTKLIVTGCLVQQHGKELLNEFAEVDAFLGTGQLSLLPDLMQTNGERFVQRTNPGGFFDPDGLNLPWDGKLTACLRVSEGCSHHCSFCVIPKIRGPLRSRTEDNIIAEAHMLFEQGVRELLIIGQDTGMWGTDLHGEQRLPKLLNALRKIPYTWIRLMYMHPYSMTDDIIQVLSESPEVFTYLDMPIQHIDNNILVRMRRKLSERDTRLLLEKIHRRLPTISLRSTAIVGFPGETEAQFKKLLDFTKEGHFDHMGTFAYSKEAHTLAGKMPRQISKKTKALRLRAIRDAQLKVADKKIQARLGTVQTILIEEKKGKFVFGRSGREAPEIDAVIQIPAANHKLNTFASVKLEGIRSR